MPTFSGFKPTGSLQLGNYLGAIRPLVDAQYRTPSTAMVADLHALTVDHDPARVRDLTLENAATLIAAGVDPAATLLFVQSAVPAHLELHYLLACVTGYGEAHRMVQFRGKRGDHTRLSLLTYPVLMAADILLHGADEVPVGADQSQHLELARAVAGRFNARYGPVFTMPRAVHPRTAARIRDLADPAAKMGKSNAHGGPEGIGPPENSAGQGGVVRLLDPPDVVNRKVRRAVTDDLGEVRFDPVHQPGVSNLVEILAACRRVPPAEAAAGIDTYARLKAAVTDEVVAVLRPVRLRYAETRARERTAPILRRAYAALGLDSGPGQGVTARTRSTSTSLEGSAGTVR